MDAHEIGHDITHPVFSKIIKKAAGFVFQLLIGLLWITYRKFASRNQVAWTIKRLRKADRSRAMQIFVKCFPMVWKFRWGIVLLVFLPSILFSLIKDDEGTEAAWGACAYVILIFIVLGSLAYLAQTYLSPKVKRILWIGFIVVSVALIVTGLIAENFFSN